MLLTGQQSHAYKYIIIYTIKSDKINITYNNDKITNFQNPIYLI